MTNVRHEDSVAALVAAKVARARNRFFTAGDFSADHRGAVLKALSVLEKQGKLRRVRRGLYWKGTATALGMAPPNPHDILGHVYGESSGVGPAGTSAALALGLTTQVPRRPVYAVPYPAEGITHARLVLRTGRRGDSRARHRLTDAEVALLEVLGSWEDSVELAPTDAVHRMRSVLRDRVRTDRVVAAAAHEPVAVRERLRALLDPNMFGNLRDALPPAANPATQARAVAVFGNA